MSKKLFLEATPSEEEKPRENLEREIIVLKEASREKTTEVGNILSENEELKERVEVLLKLLENHNIPAPCFPSRGSYSQSNRRRKMRINSKEKVFFLRWKPETESKKMEESPFFKPPVSNSRTPLYPAPKIHWQTSQSNRPSFEPDFKHDHKDIGNPEDANKINCNCSTNVTAEIYIPKCNLVPSLKLPSESQSSSREVCAEAFLAYYHPYLNIPPPGKMAPKPFPEPMKFCEECKIVHFDYFYCYYKPCAACYSKDHHFVNCLYLRNIPQGVDFNRDVFEVVCGCGQPFYQDEWFCTYCFGASRTTKLKPKFCFVCKTIGHHNYYECPEDKVGADEFRSIREADYNRAKARSLLPHTRIRDYSSRYPTSRGKRLKRT